jgi:hypothetical protein
MIYNWGQRLHEHAYSCTLKNTQTCLNTCMKEYCFNYSILLPPESYMYIQITYIYIYMHMHAYIHTYIHTYTSALLVWRVLHNSDAIDFVVSDLVIRNVICMWLVWRLVPHISDISCGQHFCVCNRLYRWLYGPFTTIGCVLHMLKTFVSLCSW